MDPLTANIIGNRLFPPGGMVEAWQACPLRFALSLVSGQDLNGANSIVVELHGSQAIAGDPPLAGIEHTLTEFSGPWNLDFTGAQMNQTVQEGHTFRSLWMCIVAVFVSTDRLEVLATREIKLHRHNASLSAPAPPDPALSWLTAEQIAAMYTPLPAHEALEERVTVIEQSGGVTPHTHVSADITDASATPASGKVVKYGAEGELQGSGVYGASPNSSGLRGESQSGVHIAELIDGQTALIRLAVRRADGALLFHGGALIVLPPAVSGPLVVAAEVLLRANNLGDLTNVPAARVNLGLGPLAILAVPDNSNVYLDGSGQWSDPQGGLAHGFYRFSALTAAADPGSGQLRLNAATWAAATAIYIDQLSDPGTDVRALVALMKPGDTLTIQVKNDSTRRARYAVAEVPTDHTGWLTIPVTVVSSAGAVPAGGAQIAVIVDYDGGGGGAPHTHVSADITDASTTGTPDKLVKYDSFGALRATAPAGNTAINGQGVDFGGFFSGDVTALIGSSGAGTGLRAESASGLYIATFKDEGAEVTRLAIRRTDGAFLFNDGTVAVTPPAGSGQMVLAGHTHLSADISDASATSSPGKVVKYGPAGQLEASVASGSAVQGTSAQVGGLFDGGLFGVYAASLNATGLKAESNFGARIAEFSDGDAEVIRLAIRRSDGALLFDDGTVAVLRAPAGGTMATQEYVQTQRPQMITPPLSSLADSRGAVADMCYDPSTPQYLYKKISVSPHKWVVSTVADSL